MPNPIDLTTTGGIATVILAAGMDLPVEWDLHPQVLALAAAQLPPIQEDISAKIPPQTRVVLIGGELPAGKFGALRSVLTRRSLTFIQRRNQAALAAALAACLPTKKPNGAEGEIVVPVAKATAPRGAIQELLVLADLSKGSAEEARRLLKIAQERGIPTNAASLAQAIAVAKRKTGRGERPRSLQTAQQKALTTLDEAIAGLQLIREYVSQTEALNLALSQKIAAFKSMARAIDGGE